MSNLNSMPRLAVPVAHGRGCRHPASTAARTLSVALVASLAGCTAPDQSSRIPVAASLVLLLGLLVAAVKAVGRIVTALLGDAANLVGAVVKLAIMAVIVAVAVSLAITVVIATLLRSLT